MKPLTIPLILSIIVILAAGSLAQEQVLYLDFNENTGQTAYDATAYNNDAAFMNEAGWDTGRQGYGLRLDGTNDYAEVADASSLDITSGITLMAWINPDSISDWTRIVCKSHTSNDPPYTLYGILFGAGSHARTEVATGGTQTSITGTSVIPTGYWTHIAGTYNGSTLILYVNGVPENSTSVSGAIDTNDVPVSIGRSSYDADYFDGIIDEVRIYNGVLSELEINTIMNMTNPEGLVQFSDTSYTVGEGAGEVTITVRRTAGSQGTASVEYTTSDGTANAGIDYTAASGTFNWADADANDKTFTVAITDDGETEGNETITITLSNASGAGMGSPNTASITITDNEQPSDAHVWLHVEGRYIRTSPYADPPNEIFIGVGESWTDCWWGSSSEAPHDGAAAKARGCNMIRGCYITLPYPVATYNSFINQRGYTMSEFIDNVMVPEVNEAKSEELYIYIDEHEYMREHTNTSTYFPTGNVWDDTQCQLWMDHWVQTVTRFKDEPWVAGFELCNEPWQVPSEQCQQKYLECLKVIREIDTQHIIFLGSFSLSHVYAHEGTWATNCMRFNPDEPYNNTVFVFHEYPTIFNMYEPSVGLAEPVVDILDRILAQYNIPMHCSEFGVDENSIGHTWAEGYQHQIEVIQACEERGFGWNIWGSNTYDNWPAHAQQQASPIPQPGSAPVATRLVCGSELPHALPADGTDTMTVTAAICDVNGTRLVGETRQVTFSITGPATWEDGGVDDRSIGASYGLARLNIRSTTQPGTAVITATANGLAQDTEEIVILGPPARVVLTAEETTLPADGISQTVIRAEVQDAQGNLYVNITSGTFQFSVAGPGSMWVTNDIQASERGVSEYAATYIIYRAGTAEGSAVITGQFSTFQTGSVTITLDNSQSSGIPSPSPEFDSLKVYPIPYNSDENLTMMFTGLEGTNAQLRIYTVTGRLVRRLDTTTTGDPTAIEWDGKNGSAGSLAPGLYVYIISNNEGYKKAGKFVVK